MRHDEHGISTLLRVTIEEALCVLLFAFFAVQGAIPGISPNQAIEMTNTAATGLMKVVGIGSQVFVDGCICILLLAHWRRLRRFAFSLQWSAAIALLAVLSTFWSQDAMTTARRSIPFALATAFGLYVASRFSIQRQAAIFCTTMALTAIASIVLSVFMPSIGLEASTGHLGNWQGVFTQKNACGRAMVFATAALLAQGRLNIVRGLCLLLFLFVLVMSGSRGAWLIEAALFASYAVSRIVKIFRASSRKYLLCGVITLMLAAAIIGWIYFPVLASSIGRDSTLSGRTAIWHQVWVAILKHPVAGYGFSAFWQGMKGESYNVILALRFVIFHAHNGFLEIWLELGGVGLAFFLLSYVRAWRKLWLLLQSPQIGNTLWMLFVMVLIGLYDIEENSLLVFNGMFWILYVAVLADIEILSVEYKLHTRMSASLPSNGQMPCVPAL